MIPQIVSYYVRGKNIKIHVPFQRNRTIRFKLNWIIYIVWLYPLLPISFPILAQKRSPRAGRWHSWFSHAVTYVRWLRATTSRLECFEYQLSIFQSESPASDSNLYSFCHNSVESSSIFFFKSSSFPPIISRIFPPNHIKTATFCGLRANKRTWARILWRKETDLGTMIGIWFWQIYFYSTVNSFK